MNFEIEPSYGTGVSNYLPTLPYSYKIVAVLALRLSTI